MHLIDFSCSYLNKLLKNISKEQKSIFLLGDFNVNLLNDNEHNQTNEFLDFLASNSFISLILQPARITSHSNTLIDNKSRDPEIKKSKNQKINLNQKFMKGIGLNLIERLFFC